VGPVAGIDIGERTYMSTYASRGSGERSPLQEGWTGDWIPVGGEIFHSHLDLSWRQPSLLYNGYVFFPGYIGRGMVLTTTLI